MLINLLRRTFIVVFASHSLGYTAVSLISNSGFETGDKTGWTLEFDSSNPGKWVVTTFLPQAGAYCLHSDNWPKYISQNFITNVNKTDLLNFSFWTLTSSTTADTPILDVRVKLADGTTQNIFNQSIATNSWQQHDMLPYIQNASFSKQISGFSAAVYGTTNPFAIDTYYDSFSISSVPEPSALSLLAVGLGVVLRHRRRTV